MTKDTTAGEESSEMPYRSPRGREPHPDETPISPYDKRELSELEETRHKRPLHLTAKNIRTTEAQLKSMLSKIGKSTQGDLRNVNINSRRAMAHNPTSFPTAQRAETTQRNLRTHYGRWADLCEEHLLEAKALSEKE